MSNHETGRVGSAMLLTNGTIRTMRSADNVAEALVVRDGRILAVGTRSEVEAACGPDRQVLDLQGCCVIPGFVDPHVHLEVLEKYDRTLNESSSNDDLLDRLSALRRCNDTGAWIVAVADVDRTMLPSQEKLDKVCPDNPTVLVLGNGNYVLNSLAGAMVDPSLIESQGAIVDRDPETGRTTGRVQTRGEDRLKYLMPEALLYTADTVQRALRLGLQELAAAGITTAHHIVKDPLPIAAYQTMAETGTLPIRVGLLLRVYESEISLESLLGIGIRQTFGSEFLRLQGIKISLDGYFPFGSSRFFQPYADEPDNSGKFRIELDELHRLVTEAHRSGMRVCLHANGDEATDAALDAFEEALHRFPRSDHRHRIEHFGNIYSTDHQMDRMASLGVVAVPNPTFMYERIQHVERRLGRHRSGRSLSLRRMISRGVAVVAASDHPGTPPPSPLEAVTALVTRRSRDGRVYGLEEALTPWEALSLYTSAGAWLGFEEHQKGTILAGKYADLALLSHDPISLPPDRISTVSVLGTMVAGQWVYASPEGPVEVDEMTNRWD